MNNIDEFLGDGCDFNSNTAVVENEVQAVNAIIAGIKFIIHNSIAVEVIKIKENLMSRKV